MAVHLSGGRKERHTVGQRSLVLRAWVAERRGRVWGVSIEGANVPRAGNTVSILHPLSLRSLAYFYSSLSETWVGSSPFPLEEFFLLLSLPVLLLLLLPCSFCMPLLCVSPPATDAVTTTCKHSGICNSNATKRGRETAAKKPQPVLALPRERVDPTPCKRYTARYSISPRKDKLYFGRTRAVHEKRIVSKRFQYFSPTTPVSRPRVIVLAPGQRNFLCSLCLWLTFFSPIFAIISDFIRRRFVWEDLGNSFYEK